MKRFKQAMLALSLLGFGTMAKGEYTLYTYFNEPYTMKGGKSGISVEIVEELFKRGNIPYKIKNLPLKRSWVTVKNSKTKACVFPVQRTQEKEYDYEWVSPLLISRSVLMAKPGAVPPVDVFADAKKFKIGVMMGTSELSYLEDFGFQTDSVKKEAQNLQKLKLGRADLWATDEAVARYYAKQNNFPIEKVLQFRTVLRGLACSKSTPVSEIDKLNSIIDELYKDNTINNIFDKYTKG